MRLTKRRYLLGFLVVVILLAVVRRIWPEVAVARTSPVAVVPTKAKLESHIVRRPQVKHRINSVPNYRRLSPIPTACS